MSTDDRAQIEQLRQLKVKNERLRREKATLMALQNQRLMEENRCLQQQLNINHSYHEGDVVQKIVPAPARPTKWDMVVKLTRAKAKQLNLRKHVCSENMADETYIDEEYSSLPISPPPRVRRHHHHHDHHHHHQR